MTLILIAINVDSWLWLDFIYGEARQFFLPLLFNVFLSAVLCMIMTKTCIDEIHFGSHFDFERLGRPKRILNIY